MDFPGLAFWLMAGFLATHELDAMVRHEWRVLPVLRLLPDETGKQVFLWAHVPFFALVMWIAGQGPFSTPALVLSAFSIVHVGLHWIFRNHPAYEFRGFGSNALIVLAGLSGAAHVAVVTAGIGP